MKTKTKYGIVIVVIILVVFLASQNRMFSLIAPGHATIGYATPTWDTGILCYDLESTGEGEPYYGIQDLKIDLVPTTVTGPTAQQCIALGGFVSDGLCSIASIPETVVFTDDTRLHIFGMDHVAGFPNQDWYCGPTEIGKTRTYWITCVPNSAKGQYFATTKVEGTLCIDPMVSGEPIVEPGPIILPGPDDGPGPIEFTPGIPTWLIVVFVVVIVIIIIAGVKVLK